MWGWLALLFYRWGAGFKLLTMRATPTNSLLNAVHNAEVIRVVTAFQQVTRITVMGTELGQKPSNGRRQGFQDTCTPVFCHQTWRAVILQILCTL